MMWAFAALRNLFKVFSAQRLILILLGTSTLANLYWTSAETTAWWKERRAAQFMQNIGIGPNRMMSKAVYVSDLVDASAVSSQDLLFPQNSTCFATFKDILDSTDMDAPWEDAGASLSAPASRSTAQRLRRTRQRLGSHRHDLLVAMRMVNSIEREMLQSEWDNWLVNEKSLCDNLDSVLGSEGHETRTSADDAAKKVMRSMSSERREVLKGWRDKHCGSCKHDYAAMMLERKRTSPSFGM